MNDDQDQDVTINRRRVLALAATASIVPFGDALIPSSSGQATDDSPSENSQTVTPPPTTQELGPTSTPAGSDDPQTNSPTPDGTPSKRARAENIQNYGAEPNPSDPDIEAARTNLQALQTAAAAAGTNGTVYVPAGTYYFGHDGSGGNRFLEFGAREPPGISIIGDGPGRSELCLTEHAPVESQSNQSFGYWNEDHDHGVVDIEQITLDGNYENIDGNFSEAGGGAWGPQFDGEGDVHLFNVRVRGWHLAGIRGRDLLRSVTSCTFEENGIKRHNETAGHSISHHVSCGPPDDGECRISRSYFRDCSGSAVDIKYRDGTLQLWNCYVEGTGANLCKLSAGSYINIRNVYHRATTESLVRRVDEAADSSNYHGKNFVQSLGERGERQVTLNTENVVSEFMNEYAFQTRNNFESGPPGVKWTGDVVVFRNTNRAQDETVIRERDEGKFVDVDITRLSIHDTGSQLFGTKNSTGTIAVLHRDGNKRLGNTGGIQIESDNKGAESFQPPVPSKDTVGINSHDRESPVVHN